MVTKKGKAETRKRLTETDQRDRGRGRKPRNAGKPWKLKRATH